MEMMILSILAPQLHCEWRLPSWQVALLTSVGKITDSSCILEGFSTHCYSDIMLYIPQLNLFMAFLKSQSLKKGNSVRNEENLQALTSEFHVISRKIQELTQNNCHYLKWARFHSSLKTSSLAEIQSAEIHPKSWTTNSLSSQ